MKEGPWRTAESCEVCIMTTPSRGVPGHHRFAQSASGRSCAAQSTDSS
jgi:hypothetical protein